LDFFLFGPEQPCAMTTRNRYYYRETLLCPRRNISAGTVQPRMHILPEHPDFVRFPGAGELTRVLPVPETPTRGNIWGYVARLRWPSGTRAG
jgi:hypothetical protein